jgi:hypothetical protein
MKNVWLSLIAVPLLTIAACVDIVDDDDEPDATSEAVSPLILVDIGGGGVPRPGPQPTAPPHAPHQSPVPAASGPTTDTVMEQPLLSSAARSAAR